MEVCYLKAINIMDFYRCHGFDRCHNTRVGSEPKEGWVISLWEIGVTWSFIEKKQLQMRLSWYLCSVAYIILVCIHSKPVGNCHVGTKEKCIMLFDFSFINPIPFCSHVASLLWKKNHVKVIHPHLLCVWLGWEKKMKRSWTSISFLFRWLPFHGSLRHIWGAGRFRWG